MKKIKLLILLYIFCSSSIVGAQTKITKSFVSMDVFQTSYFIENKGQFDHLNKNKLPIKFALENNNDHLFFNTNGLEWHLSQVEYNQEYDADNHEADSESESEKKTKLLEDIISLKWLNANPHCNIESQDKSHHYFTYGEKKYASYGYKKIIYKNLYPHIDVEYCIPKIGGIKYSLLLHAGANLKDVKFQYEGKNVSVSQEDDKLIIHNEISDLVESELKVYYENGESIPCRFKLYKNEISFEFLVPIDPSKNIIIDPWVTQISSLTTASMNANNKGYDVDYDHLGNLFVFGGGGASSPKIAKYASSGVLLWTFSGSIVSPIAWSYSSGLISNFGVDKTNGKLYAGKGIDLLGTTIIRLDSNGFYDNFITSPSPNFKENTDFHFDCNTGNMIVFGGGITTNTNVGVITPSGGFTTSGITSITTGAQDIASATISSNSEIFVALVSAVLTPSLNNTLVKLNASLNGNNWIAPSGYTTLNEPQNKPFIGLSSIGFNALYANNNYLYYYDGKHIKAFDKNNGMPVGSDDSINGYLLKYQGGIYADECDNVFVGGDNGNIKVFHFNGSNFSSLPDISLPGMSGFNIHDIKYNPANDLLYVTGDSLVATVQKNQLCIDTSQLNMTLSMNCSNAIVTLVNGDSNSLYSYIWTDSNTNTIVQTHNLMPNFSDTLFTLIPGHVYTVNILKNNFCNSHSSSLSFTALSSTYDSVNLIICHGQNYVVNGHTYTSTGQYIDTVTSIFGCDSVIVSNLTVLPLNSTFNSISICNGESIVVNGHTYANTGVYFDTLVTVFGCDSLIITNLTTIPNSIFTQNVKICEGENIVVNGHTYLSAGSYIDTLLNASGCDSILKTNLNVIKPFVSSQIIKLCNGNSYSFNNHTYTTSGVYKDTFSTIEGCDSIITTTIEEDNTFDGNIFIPNVFTPNNDNLNDCFGISNSKGIQKIKFMIYDRWGEPVFTTTQLGACWDGSYKGKPAKADVYFYYIIVKTSCGEEIFKGDVLLLK